jgi:hypothetical protein
MGQMELAARVRNVDLPRVEMAGQDEVKGIRRQPAGDPGEVTEQDP